MTIGLPVYNGDRYLSETLESILGQTCGDFQLLISDNASTDGTEEICRRFERADSRIRYLRSPENRGAAWNFNNLVERAETDYFKWAAHDDLHEATFLERCIERLDRDPSIVLCFTRTEFIDDAGQRVREYPYPVDLGSATRRDVFRLYASGGHINTEIFGVFRTAVLKQTPLIGSYVGSDHVLMGIMALAGRFEQVPEILFQHREHAGRSTHSTGGARGYTRWFDSKRSGRFAAPFWRRIFENTKTISKSSLSAREKLACYWDICRTANWNRRYLLGDLVNLFR